MPAVLITMLSSILLSNQTRLLPAAQLPLKIRESGSQTSKMTGAIMVGAAGFSLMTSSVALAVSDSQPINKQMAEIVYVPGMLSVKFEFIELSDHKMVPDEQLEPIVNVLGSQTVCSKGSVRLGAFGFAFISRLFGWLVRSEIHPFKEHRAVMV